MKKEILEVMKEINKIADNTEYEAFATGLVLSLRSDIEDIENMDEELLEKISSYVSDFESLLDVDKVEIDLLLNER